MRDLISRTRLLDRLFCADIGHIFPDAAVFINRMIVDQPAVSAVEVVRCKDCRYFDTTGYPPNRYGIDELDIGHCQMWDESSQKLGYCCHGERRVKE